jgi:hypothetical protein
VQLRISLGFILFSPRPISSFVLIDKKDDGQQEFLEEIGKWKIF